MRLACVFLVCILLVPSATAFLSVAASTTSGFATVRGPAGPSTCSMVTTALLTEDGGGPRLRRAFDAPGGADPRCAALTGQMRLYDASNSHWVRSVDDYYFWGAQAGPGTATTSWNVIALVRLTSLSLEEVWRECTPTGCRETLRVEGVLFGPAARASIV